MIEFKIGSNVVRLRPDTKIARVLTEATSRDVFYIDDLAKAAQASQGLVRFVINAYLREYVNDPTREEHKTGRPKKEGGYYLWRKGSKTVRDNVNRALSQGLDKYLDSFEEPTQTSTLSQCSENCYGEEVSINPQMKDKILYYISKFLEMKDADEQLYIKRLK